MITIISNILYDGVSLPPEAEHFLSRPRINRLLENAIEKPLTTVIAGAGYGKTQAVSTLLDAEGRIIIWLQLSELDNLIARLWERFIHGVHPHSKSLANSLRALGYPETAVAFNQLLHLLAKELTSEKHVVIVLDDFYFIHDKVVLNFLENLIYARLQNLSIVLISRTKPTLNLAGMLSKGLLSRISEDDLRFTYEEVSTYYAQQGLKPDEDMISKIYAYTGGWIFAIYLIGLSMRKGNIRELNPISLAKDDLFELIENEIFKAATDRLQEFLIRISILDAMPKGLLMELSNSDQSMLSEMTGISLFIRYDSFSDTYRIHHLFRDFLLERKNRLTEEQIFQIHLTTAKWYEKNNYKPEAIDHYKKCGCYKEIFDIILSVSRRVEQETADSFIKLIEQAPKDLIEAKPIMQVVKAHYLLNNNKIDKAYEELTCLRKKYEHLPATQENQSILGEIYIVLALISIINQNFEFEKLFKMADVCLPEGSALVDYRLNIAEGINITGIKNPVAGELNKYSESLFRTMPYASRVMNGCNYGAEYLNAADSYFMTGDIRNAEQSAYEAIALARQKRQYGVECMANFILIRVYVQKGDYTKISGVLNQMKDQLDILQNAGFISLYDIIEGWFYVKIGAVDKVNNWIRCEEETRKLLPPVVIGREYLVRSDSLLAEERYDELLAFMKQTDVLYVERGILYAIIQNKITKSIIHHYMGDYQNSIDALNEAYELSNPNKLVIQYIEYGNQMRTLIYAAKRDERCTIPMDWLDNIYTKSSSYAKQLARVTSEYKKQNGISESELIRLSARENEILNHLCQGLTRKEIADTCNLSMNTVKSILQSVYNKLGAVNSADAVHIAGTMGLIKE